MLQPEYEYTGLIATNWDLLRGDTSNWEDRFFYRDIINKSGQPVLDVGCGTGRLLLDYLADRVDIDGVDNSPEMLALCGEKAQKLGLRPNVYLQTMETLALPRKYRTIIVPSSSFQLSRSSITPGLVEQIGLLGRIGQVAGAAPAGGHEFHIVLLQHTDCGITRLAGDR